MSSYRIEVRQLENVTRAIGYVCIFWAWLEDYIGEMILDLAPLDHLKLTTKEIEQIRDVILVETDIRSKIKVLRAAFIRKWDRAWFKQVNKTLNRVDNVLRVKRNHFVHNIWTAPHGRLQRHSKHAKLRKPQAFAQEELSTQERVPVKMHEIWNLGRDIIAALTRLIGLYLRHETVQKVIDEDVNKAAAETRAKQLWAQISADPDLRDALLHSLLAISVQPTPHPTQNDTHPKNAHSKRPRQRRSSKV
jgi:hypothetical protein